MRNKRSVLDERLSARMGLLVGAAQSLDRYVGVDLRRREAAMPEQFLDCAQVGTAFEQMGRRRVPETVWSEVWRTRDRAQPVVDHPPDRSGIDARTAEAEQYGRSAVRPSQLRRIRDPRGPLMLYGRLAHGDGDAGSSCSPWR